MIRSVPSLPLAPETYDRRYQDQLNRIVTLFLQQALAGGPLVGTTLLLTAPTPATTLSAAVTDTDTSFTLHDATMFPDSGAGTIELEKFTWSGKTGNTLTGILRGQFGTVAAHHSHNTVVIASIIKGQIYVNPTTNVLMAVA